MTDASDPPNMIDEAAQLKKLTLLLLREISKRPIPKLHCSI